MTGRKCGEGYHTRHLIGENLCECLPPCRYIMTSWHGDNLRVTGPLWGESAGDPRFLSQRAGNANIGVWFVWSSYWTNSRAACDTGGVMFIWRHCVVHRDRVLRHKCSQLTPHTCCSRSGQHMWRCLGCDKWLICHPLFPDSRDPEFNIDKTSIDANVSDRCLINIEPLSHLLSGLSLLFGMQYHVISDRDINCKDVVKPSKKKTSQAKKDAHGLN